MSRGPLLFLAIVIAGLFGCGDSGGSAAPDAGPDAASDAGPDAASDATPDAGADTTAPTLISASPTDGSLVENSDALVFVFDESLDEGSIVLGGSLAAESDGGALSTTTVANDTVTVAPTSTWSGGFGRTLEVTVADAAGNATSGLPFGYDLRLVFSNFQSASVIIGQPDFTSNTRAAVSATSFIEPLGTVIAEGRLYITSESFDRVVIFGALPAENNASATSVLGQSDLMTNEFLATSAGSLRDSNDVAANAAQLAIADTTAHRVLLYSGVPTTGPVDASVVVGQAAMDASTSGCSATSLATPRGVAMSSDKLIVADTNNDRVLIWNSIPSTNGQAADVVLGQNDLDTCDIPTFGASSVGSASGIWTDGTRLLVADGRRVLMWNSFPTANNQAADVVVGQPDFTTNDDTTTASGLAAGEHYIGSNGTQLCIPDSNNHRVLIWNDIPTSNGQAADVVLGQGDFTHGTANDDDQDDITDGAPTARTMDQPTSCAFFEDKLVVGEYNNHRLTIFQSQ